MNLNLFTVSLLMVGISATCVWCHNPRYMRVDKVGERLRRSLSHSEDESDDNRRNSSRQMELSSKRLEKMLEKAILKIIMGDLTQSDILVLKSLNYSLEQVLEIRERELTKKDEDLKRKKDHKLSNNVEGELDIDEFNRQAVADYENLANKLEEELESQSKNSGKPEIIFKIHYNDTDDVNETVKDVVKNQSDVNYFQFFNYTTPLPYVYKVKKDENLSNDDAIQVYKVEKNVGQKRVSEYEGLEWVEDDVYRVIPETFNQQSDMNASNPEEFHRDYDYQLQEDSPNVFENQSEQNLSSIQEQIIAHRRDGNQSSFDSQEQKAIEDIKLRILALTGRFNLTSDNNPVQRERLTSFEPSCQIPRNTDPELWTDSHLMNIYFQLNLTSTDHVVAAKLRIYKLPQVNLPTTTAGMFGDVEEEKKIRISVFFYTKALKKNRSKKRLVDSVVTSLTTEGSHIALDVREALKFWRQAPPSHLNANNHGLLVLVEDQDGKPLKPAAYIEQDNCRTSSETPEDKIKEFLHFSSKPVLVMFVS